MINRKLFAIVLFVVLALSFIGIAFTLKSSGSLTGAAVAYIGHNNKNESNLFDDLFYSMRLGFLNTFLQTLLIGLIFVISLVVVIRH